MKRVKQIAIIAIIVMLPTCCCIGQTDTIKQKQLKEVRVRAKVSPSEVRSQTPVQVISNEKLERINATQLSDAVKQLNSVVVKDYGGVGGIKTVSARGLGSQFSTLTIDGVAVSDCQNGQIDLGKFLLGNVDYISFANANTDNIFQTARAFAAGNVIDIQTKEPRFWNKKTNANLSFDFGSFGLLNPSLSLSRQINKKLSLTLWASALTSDGDYPFTLYYTQDRTDSSSVEYRKNSEVRMGVVDANLFYNITKSQKLTAKVHYNQSYRNLPGPTTYYTQKTSERLYDKTAFVQLNYLNILSEQIRFQLNGKYNYSNSIYEDTAALNADGHLVNDYTQTEGYLSGSVMYSMPSGVKLSFNTDGAVNTLISNLENNNDVYRLSWLNVLAGAYSNKVFSIAINILSTTINEFVCDTFVKDYQRFSPYLGLSIKPFEKHNFRIRYFFKENYRIPNFNEMYYYTIAKDLNPEKALQNNVGVSYIGNINDYSFVTTTVDGYYNRVSDKIIAIPSQNLFLWSMMNIGRVDIWGLDAKVEVSLSSFTQDYTLSAAVNYSYQSALDKTAASSKTYNQQIPYTPKHSGGLALYLENPCVDLGYNATLVGDRYRMAQNTPNNLVEGYIEQSVLLAKKWDFGNRRLLQLKLQCINIFDVQYEVIKNYPMMGRNYKINISYSF